MKSRAEVSAGGVIYRRLRGRVQVCLIATQGGRAWQLPKGLIEQGEQPETAAEREVREETGLHGKLMRPLEEIEYWYVATYGPERERVHKRVYFFLFRYLRGSTRNHDHEVDDARWVSLDDARGLLSFENERRVLERAAKEIEKAA